MNNRWLVIWVRNRNNEGRCSRFVKAEKSEEWMARSPVWPDDVIASETASRHQPMNWRDSIWVFRLGPQWAFPKRSAQCWVTYEREQLFHFPYCSCLQLWPRGETVPMFFYAFHYRQPSTSYHFLWLTSDAPFLTFSICSWEGMCKGILFFERDKDGCWRRNRPWAQGRDGRCHCFKYEYCWGHKPCEPVQVIKYLCVQKDYISGKLSLQTIHFCRPNDLLTLTAVKQHHKSKHIIKVAHILYCSPFATIWSYFKN